MQQTRNYRRIWHLEELVMVHSVTPIAGWGVGKASVNKLYDFYFCEIENWFQSDTTYKLDEFMDMAAEVPVYFFLTWDSAEHHAKTVSNRYPVERRLWWLRFQSQYWFATIHTYMIDTIRYLSSDERIDYLSRYNQQLTTLNHKP